MSIPQKCNQSLQLVLTIMNCFIFSANASDMDSKLKASLDVEEVILKQTIEKFNQAFINADTATLNNLLNSQYIHTNSGSKPFGKQPWLEWLKGRKRAIQNGEFRYTDYKTKDLKIQVLGETAVVTGRNIAHGMKKNEPFNVDIRFTHVWVKSQGQWQRVAFHDAETR